MKTNVEWGEAESKISGTNVLYQARTYIAAPLAALLTRSAERNVMAMQLIWLHGA